MIYSRETIIIFLHFLTFSNVSQIDNIAYSCVDGGTKADCQGWTREIAAPTTKGGCDLDMSCLKNLVDSGQLDEGCVCYLQRKYFDARPTSRPVSPPTEEEDDHFSSRPNAMPSTVPTPATAARFVYEKVQAASDFVGYKPWHLYCSAQCSTTGTLCALSLVLHGEHGDADQMADLVLGNRASTGSTSAFDDDEKHPFCLAFLQSHLEEGFDMNTPDPQLIGSAIDYCVLNYPVDPSKVSVIGTSGSAEFANSLACSSTAERLAALVTHAGVSVEDDCGQELHRISLHGDHDTVINYGGLPWAGYWSSRDLVLKMALKQGCQVGEEEAYCAEECDQYHECFAETLPTMSRQSYGLCDAAGIMNKIADCRSRKCTMFEYEKRPGGYDDTTKKCGGSAVEACASCFPNSPCGDSTFPDTYENTLAARVRSVDLDPYLPGNETDCYEYSAGCNPCSSVQRFCAIKGGSNAFPRAAYGDDISPLWRYVRSFLYTHPRVSNCSLVTPAMGSTEPTNEPTTSPDATLPTSTISTESPWSIEPTDGPEPTGSLDTSEPTSPSKSVDCESIIEKRECKNNKMACEWKKDQCRVSATDVPAFVPTDPLGCESILEKRECKKNKMACEWKKDQCHFLDGVSHAPREPVCEDIRRYPECKKNHECLFYNGACHDGDPGAPCDDFSSKTCKEVMKKFGRCSYHKITKLCTKQGVHPCSVYSNKNVCTSNTSPVQVGCFCAWDKKDKSCNEP